MAQTTRESYQEEEEDWDAEVLAAAPYDPMKKVNASKGAILYNPQNQVRGLKENASILLFYILAKLIW